VLWEIHPFAIPSLSAKCLCSSRSCAPELAVGPYHVPGSLKFLYRMDAAPVSHPNSPPSIPSPRLPGASSHYSTGSDVTLTDTPKWAILPDSYLSTCAYCVTAFAQCSACLTRPARSTASDDIQVHIVTTPHAATTVPASEGLVSRALCTLKNSAPAHSNSFTLCPLPDGPPPMPEATHHHYHHYHHHLHLSRAAFWINTSRQLGPLCPSKRFPRAPLSRLPSAAPVCPPLAQVTLLQVPHL
jgi:hypothetical protein